MEKQVSSKKKIPQKTTIELIEGGLSAFYPDVYTTKEKPPDVPKKAIYWRGMRQEDFDYILYSIFGKTNPDLAADWVRKWKEYYRKLDAGEKIKEPLAATVPERMDEILAKYNQDLERQKLSAEQLERRKKEFLLRLAEQKPVEGKIPSPAPKKTPPIIKKAPPAPEVPAGLKIAISPVTTKGITSFAAKTLFAPVNFVIKNGGWRNRTAGTAAALSLSFGVRSSALKAAIERKPDLSSDSLKRLEKLIELMKNIETGSPVIAALARRAYGAGTTQLVFDIQEINIPQAQFYNLAPTGNTVAFPQTFFAPKGIFGNIGQWAFGKASSLGLKKLAEKTGVTTAIKIGGKKLLSKIGTAIGSTLGGIPGAIIGWIGSEIITKVGSWLKRHKEAIVGVSGAIAGFFVGGIPGLIIGGALAFGAAAVVTQGAQAATTQIGGAIQTGLIGITSLVLPTIGAPVVVALISIPIIVAIILFIINSGAYIVPPFTAGGEIPTECQGEGPLKPEAKDILFSPDGKYAYPLAPSSQVGEDCTHWDKTLATDIFPIGGNGVHTPVIAYTNGIVHETATTDPKGGKYIILKGNDGQYYYYAHNCALYVRPGQGVSAGEVIATTDRTGSAAQTPEHLHFAISNFPRFQEGGTVCPSEDFANKFSGYNRCPPEKRCVP